MSTLKKMLALNDGSFTKAEAMGLRLLGENHPEVWLDLEAVVGYSPSAPLN